MYTTGLLASENQGVVFDGLQRGADGPHRAVVGPRALQGYEHHLVFVVVDDVLDGGLKFGKLAW